MPEQNLHYVPNDTINLRQLVAILKKRKNLIIAVTGLSTLLALAYAFFIAKPVYEAKSMIEIGQIDSKPIDDIKNLQQKLIYKYSVNNRRKRLELPRVTAISTPRSSGSLLSFTIQAYSKNEALAYIEQIIRNIEKSYNKKTDVYIENQKKMIKLIGQEIANNEQNLQKMQKEINTYEQKIISLKSKDAALAGIYTLQIGQKQIQLQNLKTYISSLKEREQSLKLSITPLKMQMTHIAGETEVTNTPVKPKKKLIGIVAFITGLMLSVFLAFFLEFLAGLKEEDNVSSTH